MDGSTDARAPVSQPQRTARVFLGNETGNQSSRYAPIAKSERLKYYGNPFAHCCKQTHGRIFYGIQSIIESLQKPYRNCRYEYYRKGSLQKVFCFFPQKQTYAFGRGEAVIGQFHNEGGQACL